MNIVIELKPETPVERMSPADRDRHYLRRHRADRDRLDSITVEQHREDVVWQCADDRHHVPDLPHYDDLDGWARELAAERSAAHLLVERLAKDGVILP